MQPQSASLLNSPLVPLVLMFGVMYLLLFLPRQREMKKLAELLKSLKKGDSVLTASGIIGTITSLTDERAVLKMVDGAKIEFLRSAITQRLAEGKEE